MDNVATMTPQQGLMNTEIDRLKKFYQGQYEVEASRFAKQKMPDKDFQEVMSKLQSKYKLAFNEAKFQSESRSQSKEPTAMKQFGDLDIYKNRIDTDLKNFRAIPGGEQPSMLRASRQPPSKGMLAASILPPIAAYNIGRSMWPKEKISPEQVEVLDRTMARYDKKSGTWKSGEWRTAKPEEVQQFGMLKSESERVQTLQNALIGKPTSALMKTAVTSKRMGGSIAEQTKNYLQQKETGTQRQEPEDFSKMSDDELRRIAGGR